MMTYSRNELISVIVPIYNVEREIDRCIQSILKQTYHQLEIILVDDGSPDQCPQKCDQYAHDDSRVKVIHKKNGGLSDARNAGLRIATGEYVLYVDSDDYLELDACERLLKSMSEDVDIVVGECREVEGNEVSYQRHTNLSPEKIYSAEEYMIQSIDRNEWFHPAWLNLYRRNFLIINNLFFIKDLYFEDMEMTMRLWLASPRMTYLNYPFYVYVKRGGSIMTAGNKKKKIKDVIRIFTSWMSEIDSLPDSVLKSQLYRDTSRKYIAFAIRLGIDEWRVAGIDFPFALKYSKGFIEKFKIIFFATLPKTYQFLFSRIVA
ncbi:glycosyltransferase family 2 protein [Bifidobacterium breve]|uniref:glycosyltransferase family 2 protein n=1 Tax=Bifidobacterium breve TaxID=1685 RepID=UPI002CA1303A|nr:glycosyltransferase [Bifidobacterium breve]MEB3518021.1 glycosyltransferase [Bifidobacterium breve]